MSANFVKGLFHVRATRHAHRPVATVAYRCYLTANTIHYTIAIHNPKDKYDRKLGNRIAEGRFENDKNVVDIDIDCGSVDLKRLGDAARIRILEDLSKHKNTRVRNHAAFRLIHDGLKEV